ncbi:MAG: hypothetical protein JSV04_13955 [Candidatus Heimdallarchaeota archaeon]|nr:MAG: hypothetical protein JSV04_13955 [Candidatus Heimdallarchaeota archaeon]
MFKLKNWTVFFLSFLIVFPITALDGSTFHISPQITILFENDLIESEFNRYTPDGNSSVLIALDSQLLGEGKYFADEEIVKQRFETWFDPFEKTFNVSFHVKNVTTFTPGSTDSLNDSMRKVPGQISWNLAAGVNDTNVQGNGCDWLIIYQEHYRGGRNHANAVFGNTFIIAHNQLLFDRQLILLHEIGHLFGGRHFSNGTVNQSWYNGEPYSIMDYNDLVTIDNQGWDEGHLPFDKKNYETINNTKFRFDLNDAELDGLPNYYEYHYKSDPTINDSHKDLDNDGLSTLEEFQQGTNPIHIDSDYDGYSDWAEKYVGTSPLNSSEIPQVDKPIIVSWTPPTTINEDQDFIIEWRAISSNPSHLEIYQNNSLEQNLSWTEELIQYHPVNISPGNWNFTCLVVDGDGEKSAAEIWIQVLSTKKTSSPSIFGSLAGICLLVILYRKKTVLKGNHK